MKVSVVIAAWNKQELLDSTLADLARQTVKPDEIMVVDDGSNPALVIPETVSCLRLGWHEKPRTSGFARNAGIACATFDAIIICDHDQAIVSDAIESLMTDYDDLTMKTARRFGLGCQWDGPTEANEIDAYLRAHDMLLDTSDPGPEQCLAMIPRRVFEMVGLYDTDNFKAWGWTNLDFHRRVKNCKAIRSVAAQRPSGHTLFTFDRPHEFFRDFRAAANEYHAKYGHLSLNQQCDGCAGVGLHYEGNGVENNPVFDDEDRSRIDNERLAYLDDLAHAR